MPSPRPITHLPSLPLRPADAHKGSFGTVIVVGGSPAMIGAPAICASAAIRSGAGLVKIAAASCVLPHAITIEPTATGILLQGEFEHQLQAIDRADPRHTAVLAVGPGMGTDPQTGRLVLALLKADRAAVLDADGLNLLAQTREPRPDPGPPLVMTPHPGEFHRLARPLGITESPVDPGQRPLAAIRLARAHRATVLLKGRRTIITDGGRIYENATGNPALAAAGSGDVLTGVIASLIAQGMDPFDAACLGAHLHGLAADQWSADHGRAGLAATDLARRLPHAMHTLRRK